MNLSGAATEFAFISFLANITSFSSMMMYSILTAFRPASVVIKNSKDLQTNLCRRSEVKILLNCTEAVLFGVSKEGV